HANCCGGSSVSARIGIAVARVMWARLGRTLLVDENARRIVDAPRAYRRRARPVSCATALDSQHESQKRSDRWMNVWTSQKADALCYRRHARGASRMDSPANRAVDCPGRVTFDGGGHSAGKRCCGKSDADTRRRHALQQSKRCTRACPNTWSVSTRHLGRSKSNKNGDV